MVLINAPSAYGCRFDPNTPVKKQQSMGGQSRPLLEVVDQTKTVIASAKEKPQVLVQASIAIQDSGNQRFRTGPWQTPHQG